MQPLKHLFSIPENIHYFNCAAIGPLPKKVEEAGIKGILQKSQPHQLTSDRFFDTLEVVKTAFAQLIGCADSQRIAIMGSVSYGLAIVTKNILKKGLATAGKKIVMPGDEFPSIVYAWDELKEKDVQINLVSAPDTKEQRGLKWNEKLLEAIDEKTLLVCLSPTHWSDGTLFNLKKIGERCRETGALFIIDGTQHVGAYPFNIEELKPDFLIVAAYKWLLGPYGNAIAYVSEWLDDGTPLEQNWAMRKNSDDFKSLVQYQQEYRPKAYRYNIGEMSNFTNLPMLAAALQQVNEWSVATVQEYGKNLLRNYLPQLQQAGYYIEEENARANHLFGIRLPEGHKLEPLQHELLQQRVYVSYRGTAIRVSVHVWNDEKDMQTLTEILLKHQS